MKTKNNITPPNLPLSREEHTHLPLTRGTQGVYQKSSSLFSHSSSLLGFTLVELIVVITILTILGTIGFIQIGSFQGSARDSSRVSDLANISKGLDISSIKTGTYPTPDNAFTVTYSGGTLWSQGTVGDSVINIIGAGGVKMSKKPTDPLTITQEYTYSKLAYGNAYQLKTDWEGESVVFSPHPASPYQGEELIASLLSKEGLREVGFGISKAHAASGNPTIAYIKGNYNGIVAKTQTGSQIYILAIPSLFLNSNTGSVIFPTTTATGFYLHGYTNSGGILFTGSVIYSSGSLPSNDAERILFASGIALAYSGTLLASNSNIEPIITALVNNNTGTLASLGGSIVSGSLGGSASTTGGGGGGSGGGTVPSCTTEPSYVHATFTPGDPTTTNQSWTQTADTGTACRYECTDGYTGADCGTPPLVTYTNIDGSLTSYIPDSANGSTRFTLSASDTIVTDSITGLMWQSYKNTGSADYTGNYSTTKTWANAKTYCAGLSLGSYGAGSWRLPDYTELQSIIDYFKSTSPAVDVTYFGSQSNFYWSSTTYAPSTTTAWVVNFKYGNATYTNKTNSYYVRCIR